MQQVHHFFQTLIPRALDSDVAALDEAKCAAIRLDARMVLQEGIPFFQKTLMGLHRDRLWATEAVPIGNAFQNYKSFLFESGVYDAGTTGIAEASFAHAGPFRFEQRCTAEYEATRSDAYLLSQRLKRWQSTPYGSISPKELHQTVLALSTLRDRLIKEEYIFSEAGTLDFFTKIKEFFSPSASIQKRLNKLEETSNNAKEDFIKYTLGLLSNDSCNDHEIQSFRDAQMQAARTYLRAQLETHNILLESLPVQRPEKSLTPKTARAAQSILLSIQRKARRPLRHEATPGTEEGCFSLLEVENGYLKNLQAITADMLSPLEEFLDRNQQSKGRLDEKEVVEPLRHKYTLARILALIHVKEVRENAHQFRLAQEKTSLPIVHQSPVEQEETSLSVVHQSPVEQEETSLSVVHQSPLEIEPLRLIPSREMTEGGTDREKSLHFITTVLQVLTTPGASPVTITAEDVQTHWLGETVTTLFNKDIVDQDHPSTAPVITTKHLRWWDELVKGFPPSSEEIDVIKCQMACDIYWAVQCYAGDHCCYLRCHDREELN